jgi:hypothetical protein
MNQQETAAPSTTSAKQVRKEIEEKLTGALADYKQKLGEKKLATHVKKVSKLISRDLKKISKKQQERTKKAAPKKANQKPVKK